MSNPVLKVNKSLLDFVLEIIIFIGLCLLILIPAFYFDDLPKAIPTHFDLNGQPDDYSSKSTIWLLPIIGLILGAGLYILNKFPHIFNYPAKINVYNAPQYYKNSTKLIRVLNLIVTWTFVLILEETIQVALEKSSGLGIWFVPLFLCTIFGVIIYFVLKSYKT